MIHNERGFLTVDFIFAIVMIFGFTALLFVVSITLSMVSVTQYITFAAARNYDGGHIDLASQEKQAKAKYTELISNKTFKPLYAGNWFKVLSEPQIGDHTQIIPGYTEATQGTNEFWGVSTTFLAKPLDFHIPFFGDSAPDSDGSGSGFKTNVGSYLGREPTQEECQKLIAQRWTAIRALSVANGAAYSQGTPSTGYFPMEDNGC